MSVVARFQPGLQPDLTLKRAITEWRVHVSGQPYLVNVIGLDELAPKFDRLNNVADGDHLINMLYAMAVISRPPSNEDQGPASSTPTVCARPWVT